MILKGVKDGINYETKKTINYNHNYFVNKFIDGYF